MTSIYDVQYQYFDDYAFFSNMFMQLNENEFENPTAMWWYSIKKNIAIKTKLSLNGRPMKRKHISNLFTDTSSFFFFNNNKQRSWLYQNISIP